jgi:hypothetical protein
LKKERKPALIFDKRILMSGVEMNIFVEREEFDLF